MIATTLTKDPLLFAAAITLALVPTSVGYLLAAVLALTLPVSAGRSVPCHAAVIRRQYHSYSGLNRAALRLALALITWSRRARIAVSFEQHERQLARQAALEFRDRALAENSSPIR